MDAGDDRSIRIYACLNALKGENADVLAPLAYFFEEYFFISHSKVFSQSNLVAFAKNALGWNITEDIAEDFVRHFEKMGWLTRRGTDDQALYLVNHQRPAGQNVDPTAALIETLRSALSQFMREHAPHHSGSLSDDDLLDSFLKWLMNLKVNTNPADYNNSGVTDDEVTPSEDIQEHYTVSINYFFARFVEETIDTDPVLADSIPNLWAVGMLLEVADEITKPATLSQNSDLRIIIDAPVAMSYLGLDGKKSQQGISLVLDSLKAIGCKICALDISCQEINRALSSLLKNTPEDRYGRTADALRIREVNLERVEHVRAHPDTALSENGVEILSYRLENTKALEKHFSSTLYDDYLASVGWGDTIDAKVHDATAFALAVRLRHGKHSSEFFRNTFVFVTQNEKFCRSSRQYALKAQVLNEHHVPPIFSTRKLATITWLQTGLSVSKTEIPRGILVNVCARITSTKRDILVQARQDIAALTEEEQEEYRALATHPRSTRVLMDYYEARPQILDGAANPGELLARMEAALAEEHETKAAKAIADVEQRTASAIKQVSDEKAASEAELQDSRRTIDGLVSGICSEVVRQVNNRSLYTKIVLIVVLGAISIALLIAPTDWPVWLRTTAVLAAAALTLSSTYFTFFSSSGPRINRKIGEFWARRGTAELRRRGISQDGIDIVVDSEGKATCRKKTAS